MDVHSEGNHAGNGHDRKMQRRGDGSGQSAVVTPDRNNRIMEITHEYFFFCFIITMSIIRASTIGKDR